MLYPKKNCFTGNLIKTYYLVVMMIKKMFSSCERYMLHPLGLWFCICVFKYFSLLLIIIVNFIHNYIFE